jgi:hypothetical protein
MFPFALFLQIGRSLGRGRKAAESLWAGRLKATKGMPRAAEAREAVCLESTS